MIAHPTRRSFRQPRTRSLLEHLESRILLTAFNANTADPIHLSLNYAVYRSSVAGFYADTNRDGAADKFLTLGQSGDKIVTGDINGDGLTDIGVFRSGSWLIDVNRDGVTEVSYTFGQAGDTALIGDVDSDGYGDLILYRAGTWLVSTTRTNIASQSTPYGSSTDRPIIGDFNGDGRLDRGVYRPSTGVWYVDSAFSGVLLATYTFGGQTGDVPFAADFNDDKFADLGIARNGNILVDASRTGTASYNFAFGGAGDTPVMGYYSTSTVAHTLRTGLGLFNPANGQLSLDPAQTGSVTSTRNLGIANDQLVAADFDGNTVTDTAIFRNGTWLLDTNHDSITDSTISFGQAADLAASGDVNNDGFADLILFRNGTWLVDTNRNGAADLTSSYGTTGDLPVVGDLNGDGVLDRAIYRSGTWHVDFSFDGSVDTFYNFGGASDKPLAFDFNYDGKDDIGVYRNGTWLVDISHTSFPSLIYNFGTTGVLPIAGRFETANSVFVRAGASGNGTEANPYGSIYTATLNASNGAFIRIAPGAYNEAVVVAFRSNLTYVSANRFSATVTASNGNAFYLDRSANIYLHNLTLRSTSTNANFGKGLVLYGATAFARGIVSINNVYDNVLTAAPTDGFTQLYLRDANIGQSQTGAGLFNQGSSILQLTNVASTGNGTSGTKSGQWGRGIVISGNRNQASIRAVNGNSNNDHGFVADGTGDMLLLSSTFNNNPNANGAIIAQLFSFTIDGCTFNNNGVKGNSAKLFNGLELDITGNARGIVTNSTFSNNAAYGLFLGGGPLFYVTFNTMSFNGLAQLLVNGVDFRPAEQYVTGSVLAYVVGNSLSVTAGNTAAGLTGAGSGAVAYIGGSESWQKNTFTNFAQYSAIFVDRDPNNLSSIANFYCLPQSSNTFVNSTANPIGGYGAKTLP